MIKHTQTLLKASGFVVNNNIKRFISACYKLLRESVKCKSMPRLRIRQALTMLKYSTKYLQIVCKFVIRETRYANYRVAVGLLIGQGWEQLRPALPKLQVNKARPEVLVFLRLNYLLVGREWLKTMFLINSICPRIRLSTRQ